MSQTLLGNQKMHETVILPLKCPKLIFGAGTSGNFDRDYYLMVYRSPAFKKYGLQGLRPRAPFVAQRLRVPEEPLRDGVVPRAVQALDADLGPGRLTGPAAARCGLSLLVRTRPARRAEARTLRAPCRGAGGSGCRTLPS